MKRMKGKLNEIQIYWTNKIQENKINRIKLKIINFKIMKNIYLLRMIKINKKKIKTKF